MKLEIPLEIINETTHCTKNFVCLEQPETLCKLDHLFGKCLILENPPSLDCHYKTSFGSKFFCSCPTRRAIYDRYKV